MIQVTAAIIQRDGKLLLCQRPKGKRCELLWEFPGGKIKRDETPEECLVRECREELGITIKTEQLAQKVEYVYPDITVNIHFYYCKLIDGEPVCIEHNDIQWFTLDEASKMPLCPADNKMLNLVSEDIKGFLSMATSKSD
ncbi:MAG: (deoxy)nucleoside triphosphate pyrophosphohydrolase [Bacillota bacterium]|nr:(deoxy)nucleoside triphosphate pyrophosphohydrolase [Bacillota bacterium]NLV64271.1 (deoxy)nucleoside triphosphate pyrophosphohydrolase [Clostridiaceae bacterium]